MSSVALVTGAGRGLGRSFAVALAKRGMALALASRNRTELNNTAAVLQDLGTQAIAIPTDVTDQVAVHHLVSTTEEKLGPIDLLINGAGVGGRLVPPGKQTRISGGGMSRSI
jgi:NAD(P)-dependent dehydrogenase (short-subunit alcohol dehydrogenase family)